MIKLSTPVLCPPLGIRISLQDKIMVLGSCFADNMGARLAGAGFDVCVNPFGTLYNPVSICNTVARMDSGIPFRAEECVEMGAGAGLMCSFSHHSSFARKTREEFLENADRALAQASRFWKECNKVIITLGTAMVWKLADTGEVVSNCLKRPEREFSHEMLGTSQIETLLQHLVQTHPDKEFIFTVSPIRHMSCGAHANTLSKAALQLALSRVTYSARACYFPAYEILLDELRDYRFYADDLCHPGRLAEEIIWQRFLQAGVPESEMEQIARNEKAARLTAHRPIHTEK